MVHSEPPLRSMPTTTPVGSGSLSHAYIQYPPSQVNIPAPMGVMYDDGNKLLLVPSANKVQSWPVNQESPLEGPSVTNFVEGPVIFARFSLDEKILAVQRSGQDVEFVKREDGIVFRQRCKQETDQILGLFWTDCPACDLVLVTNSGLELYTLTQDRTGLKLVEAKKLTVSWYVYTHESRLVLLASGMQCKSLSGFQFSAGGIVRLPKFDVAMAKAEVNSKPVLAFEDVHIATMYGRLYCLQVDRVAMQLHLYRFYRDAVVLQGFRPIYSVYVAISVVDNVLLVHEIDSKVILLYDIMSDSTVPVSAPLPLLVRGVPVSNLSRTALESSSNHGISSLEDDHSEGPIFAEGAVYENGWVFVNPDLVLDHNRGLLWKIQLDLEAIAASSSDMLSLLAFLQRRSHESSKAKLLSLDVVRSMIMERQPLPLIARAMGVLTSSYARAVKHANDHDRSIVRERGGNSNQQNDARAVVNELGELKVANSPIISPEEMQHSVFSSLEKDMIVDSSFMVATIIEYLYSAATEHLSVTPGLQVLIIQLLAQQQQYYELWQLIVGKVVTPSKAVALQLLQVGTQDISTRKLGLDMLQELQEHTDIVNLLLQKGRVLHAVRYARQSKMEIPAPSLFLQAAIALKEPQKLASVFRFCVESVPYFKNTSEFNIYESILRDQCNTPAEGSS